MQSVFLFIGLLPIFFNKANAAPANAEFTAPGATSCSTLSHIKETFFGYPDNSPPGAAIAYSCGRKLAGG